MNGAALAKLAHGTFGWIAGLGAIRMDDKDDLGARDGRIPGISCPKMPSYPSVGMGQNYLVLNEVYRDNNVIK